MRVATGRPAPRVAPTGYCRVFGPFLCVAAVVTLTGIFLLQWLLLCQTLSVIYLYLSTEREKTVSHDCCFVFLCAHACLRGLTKLTVCSFPLPSCRTAAREFSFSEEPIKKSRITTARLLFRWGSFFFLQSWRDDFFSRDPSSTYQSSMNLVICFIFSWISFSPNLFSALNPASVSWRKLFSFTCSWSYHRLSTTGPHPKNKRDSTKAFRLYINIK